jgi:hypothetical protein
MSKAGKRLVDAAEEILQVARGEIPHARLHIGGWVYVPESAVAEALAAERERCARIANGAWLAIMDAEASAVAKSIFDDIREGA